MENQTSFAWTNKCWYHSLSIRESIHQLFQELPFWQFEIISLWTDFFFFLDCSFLFVWTFLFNCSIFCSGLFFFYLGQNSLCGSISFLLFGTFIVLLPFSLYIYILFFLLHFFCVYGPTFVLCVGCFLFGPFSFYRPVIFVWAIICFRLACLDFFFDLPLLHWASFFEMGPICLEFFFQFSFGLPDLGSFFFFFCFFF